MKRAFQHYQLKKQLEVLEQVKAIYDADDGRSDDEKKEESEKLLSKRLEELREMIDSENIENDVVVQIANEFWENNDTELMQDGIILRRVAGSDKDKFIELEIENSALPDKYEDESFRDSMWEGHNDDTSIVFTIEKDEEYVGYCAIKDIAKIKWEISIELLRKFHRQGIGYTAISMMLDAVKERLGVSEFRIRIYSDNIASRKLFEKLGAVPNGISEFLIHNKKDIDEFEEMYMHTITDDLREVAKQFNVEPRKLLSHVLEYKLVWGK